MFGNCRLGSFERTPRLRRSAAISTRLRACHRASAMTKAISCGCSGGRFGPDGAVAIAAGARLVSLAVMTSTSLRRSGSSIELRSSSPVLGDRAQWCAYRGDQAASSRDRSQSDPDRKVETTSFSWTMRLPMRNPISRSAIRHSWCASRSHRGTKKPEATIEGPSPERSSDAMPVRRIDHYRTCMNRSAYGLVRTGLGIPCP